MLKEAAFSPMMMATGDQKAVRTVRKPLRDSVERGYEAALHAERTRPVSRAWSKPAARVSDGGHEESKPAK